MTVLVHNPSGVAPPQGNYALGTSWPATHRLLATSGQVPVRPDGTIPHTFEEQCHVAWHNVEAVLGDAGMTVHDIRHVRTFLARREDISANGAIRRAHLGTLTPALTVVIAGMLDPAWLLEIEVLASSPPGTRDAPPAP